MIRYFGLIYPPYVWRAVGLSAFLWLALHGTLALLGTRDPVTVVLACTFVVHLDLRRYSAHLFYANLGIAPVQGTLLAFLSALSLELAAEVTTRLTGFP